MKTTTAAPHLALLVTKTTGGDADSKDAATEVRALAGVHAERPN